MCGIDMFKLVNIVFFKWCLDMGFLVIKIVVFMILINCLLLICFVVIVIKGYFYLLMFYYDRSWLRLEKLL